MEKVRLGEYISILSGFAFKSALFSSDNTFTPIIRIRDIKRGFSETFYNGDFKKEYIVNSGELLIGMDGEFNAVLWTGIPSLLNQRVCKITSNNENLLVTKYLYYGINEKLKEIEDKTSFVTVKHLSINDINSIEIPLPSLSIQKEIAAKLDKADEIRRINQQLITKYDELTQSLFLDMFGDPVKNEKGWEKDYFKNVGTLDRGKSKHRPRNAPELLGGKYPLIQTGDVANSKGYITDYKSTYSEIGLAQSKMWNKGTLCITIAANIAKTGILTFDACFPDSIVGFIHNEKTNTIYVQFWLSFLQKILEDSAPESAQKNINLDILKKLEIPLPPISLQNQFAARVQAIEVQKQLAQEALAKSETLFQSLLQESFKD